jgi:hypothetical protein
MLAINARSCRSTRGNQPDSPETKKLTKLQDRTIEQLACKELLKIKVENISNLIYGDLQTILDKYSKKGFTSVTCRNLRYRMELLEKHKGVLVCKELFSIQDITRCDLDEMSPIIDNNNQSTVSQSSSDSSNKNKNREYLQLVKTLTTTVTTQLKELMAINGDKRLPPKSLNHIICNVETEIGLLPGTMNQQLSVHVFVAIM